MEKGMGLSVKTKQYGLYALYAIAVLGTLGLMVVQLLHAYCSGSDTGYYLSISNRISDGYKLYRDVACGYTPLHLYVCAGLKWLFHIPVNCYWPYLLLQQLLRVGGALFVYGIARELKATKVGALLAACYVSMLFFKEEGMGILLEVPSVFWGLGGCFALLHFRNKSVWHMVWIGCVLAGAYLTKQYGLGFLPLGIMLLFFYTERKDWWKRILLLVAGYALPILAVVLYFGDSFYYVLFPTYGTSFLNTTEIEYTFTMRVSNILQATFRNLLNYALVVATAFLLLPWAIKQNKWRMFVFALCGFLGFSLQYYFTITIYAHYALYMIPFVALLIAWISRIDAPKWLLVAMWLSVAYCFLKRGYRLVGRDMPAWCSEQDHGVVRDVTAYCDAHIPPQSKVFLESYWIEAIYFNAQILPTLMNKYGYSFGPSALNYEQALEQLKEADFAILGALDENGDNYYYFSERLHKRLEGHPCDVVDGLFFIYDLRDSSPFAIEYSADNK